MSKCGYFIFLHVVRTWERKAAQVFRLQYCKWIAWKVLFNCCCFLMGLNELPYVVERDNNNKKKSPSHIRHQASQAELSLPLLSFAWQQHLVLRGENVPVWESLLYLINCSRPEASYFFWCYIRVSEISWNNSFMPELLLDNIYFWNLHGNSRHDDARQAP